MKLHDSVGIVPECMTAALKETGIKTTQGVKYPIFKRVPCPRIDIDNATSICPVCTTYRWPAAKWYQNPCPFAGKELATETTKKLNPLKASKRRAKGK